MMRACVDVGRCLVRDAVRVLAALTLVDVVIRLATGRGTGWMWVDLPWVAGATEPALLAGAATALLLAGRLPARVRILAPAVAAGLALACFANALTVLELAGEGGLTRSFPVPSSLLYGGLLALAAGQGVSRTAPRPRGRLASTVGIASLVLAGMGAQVMVFGASDYRRPADAIVVFGARVDADGTPSLALADRVDTACRLFEQGLAPRIVLSGGRDPAVPLSEPEAMRRRCLERGIPESALILDPSGANTLASVQAVAELAAREGFGSFLMVSHDYHLARIKMFAERQGLRVYTVPAEETRPLLKKAKFVVRELAALVFWYVSPRSFA